ncbi:TspO/MBR family protein [Rhizobium paknamense]|uniref:Tryptophan-rich sensory protein n=1 Tax=Rhizobium paknamense TaxID=1206817 RepID=A0ABU0ID34_9HYPH|nr:TspO/MBR family protein [Rhizobium paknamense]MDQ0455345.1 tryptophan-rich sensory protein [Rhizobium paknamense]
MRRAVPYAVFILVVVGLGSLMGLLNLPGEWYQSLQKPSFNPPAWIFGPVWTALYVMIGIAGARIWLLKPRSTPMALWLAQMVLNLLWTPAFFGLHSPGFGLVVIVPLLALILGFIVKAWPMDRLASVLFWPYAAWVSFASLLNLSLFLLN